MKNFFFIFSLFLSAFFSAQTVKTITVEQWTGTTWKNDVKFSNVLDNNFFIGITLQENWSPSSTWTASSKQSFTNSSSGALLNALFQNWSFASNTFTDYSTTSYSYNSTGQQTVSIRQNFTNSNWVNAQQILNNYNSSGWLITSLNNTWNGSLWLPTSKLSYTNNASGQVVQFIDQTWDASNSTWKNAMLRSMTYNGFGKLDTLIYQTWTGSSWKNTSRILNSYDNNNFLVHQLQETWDMNLNNWKALAQQNYTNNNDGSINFIIVQVNSANMWVNSSRYTYTYFPFNSTGIATPQQDAGAFLYYDIYGKPVEKRFNEVLIERSATGATRKIYFSKF